MRIIGITGGVGAGKSALLSYIKEHYSCRVILADEAAHEVEQPGELCYDELVALLGQDICDKQGYIVKSRMAERIFGDDALLKRVNEIVHPAVKQYIIQEIEKEKARGEVAFFFIEAALLIEERYDLICDELWYIYTDVRVRRERLRNTRGYSDEKIDAIMGKQLSEEAFRAHCQVVIDNSGALETAFEQIDVALGGIQNGSK